MTKRERLEDMGVALEKMNTVLDDDFWDDFTSKHQIDEFTDKCVNDNGQYLDNLHGRIRYIRESLVDIHSILQGDLYEPMGRCF